MLGCAFSTSQFTENIGMCLFGIPLYRMAQSGLHAFDRSTLSEDKAAKRTEVNTQAKNVDVHSPQTSETRLVATTQIRQTKRCKVPTMPAPHV